MSDIHTDRRPIQPSGPDQGQDAADRALGAALDGLSASLASPPSDFAAGVLVALCARPNAVERFWNWLAGDPAASTSVFDAMLDNRLSRRQERELKELAMRVPEVARALGRWRRIQRELAELPLLAPSDRFAGHVMAQVRRAQAASPSTQPDAVVAPRGLGALRPVAARLGDGRERRRRLAKAWRIPVWPAAALTATVYLGFIAAGAATYSLVFANHPQLTLPRLAGFAWSRASEAAAALGADIQGFAGSVGAAGAAARSGLAGAAPLGAGALLAFAGLMVASMWILYRNVVPNREREGRRAFI